VASKPFTAEEREAIAAAEDFWNQLQPLNAHFFDEYANKPTLKLLRDLRTSLGRSMKALASLIDDGSPIGLADVEGRISTAHQSSNEVARLFPDAPLQYALVDGGRSYLEDELQRLKVLHQALDGLDNRRWSKERRAAQSFVFLAADCWAARVGAPSGKGRFLTAIQDLATDQNIKKLERESVVEYLKKWKERTSTTAPKLQG
jgi:hypothetical protein